jgi:hypothetical protein
MVQHLPSEHEALNSNLRTIKKTQKSKCEDRADEFRNYAINVNKKRTVGKKTSQRPTKRSDILCT